MRNSALASVVLGALCLMPAAHAADPASDVAGREYHASRQGEIWQAPNRAQGIRTFFHEAGIRVVPRTGTPGWSFGLTLTRWGRPGALADVEMPRLRAGGSRVDYDRRGPVAEWYENGPRGLEQGFTLERPPSDSGATVLLEMELSGTLLPALAADGQAIDFSVPGGGLVLHYAGLLVRDAQGRDLPARMELFWRGIRLVLEDADAVYPIVVDPLATSPSWSAESDQAEAQLGTAVAGAGDVNGDGYGDVVVGAPLFDNFQVDDGRAFLYLGSPSGLATSPAWTAAHGEAGAQFGAAVATAGDVNGDGYADVLVGAPLFDNFEAEKGRAFLYLGSATGLAASPSWLKEGGQAMEHFGAALGTAGDVNADGYADVVVGAPLYANGQSQEGRALVYLGSPSGLSPTPAWSGEGNQAGAKLGLSVGTAGDVNGDGYADLIVGAPYYDNGQADEGRAFVYLGSGTGLAASPVWTAERDEANTGFGWSVSTAGDVNGDGYADVIVGSPGALVSGRNGGNVFAYYGSASGPSPTVNFTGSGGPQQGSAFGWSVGTVGDANGDGYADVIVGSPDYLNSGQMGQLFGYAAVYFGSASGLTYFDPWSVQSTSSFDRLGWSVAAAGDVNGDGYGDALVGGPFYSNGQAGEGRALLYLGSARGLTTFAGSTLESNQVSAQLGTVVASAGDVNGDGYADVVVGAGRYDNGQSNEGKAFLFLGSAAGIDLSQPPAWTAEGDQADALFGFSVAGTGDVNGDGYDDLVVGAPNFQDDQIQEGRVFLYLGSPAGPPALPSWTADGNQQQGQFGSIVASAGDVNGDGYADLLVTTPVGDAVQVRGRAVIYHGSPSGLPATPSWSIVGDQTNAAFAAAAASAGDVNGDGYGDVILGAYNYSNGQANEGRAFVYLGAASGLATSPVWTTESNQVSALFGWSVAGAGDVDGDGFGDIVVGAYLYDSGQSDEGKVFLYRGSATGPLSTASWTVEPNVSGRLTGYAVASAGDVNGDGYADLIVGSIQGAGRADLYLGSGTGPSTSSAWSPTGSTLSDNLGYAVASAGDVNGDGYADVLVGAPGYGNGQGSEGRALLYYGNAVSSFSGLAVRAQQQQWGGGRIGRYGVSQSTHAFQLSLVGRSPFGRARVSFQAEVRPVGTPFTGVSTQIGDFFDTSVSGVPLDLLVSNQPANARYHWRVRTVYDSRTPLLQHGRWLTIPWGSWTETMLRTAQYSAGESRFLTMDKGAGFIALSWFPSCLGGETDAAVYEGTIPNWGTTSRRTCTTGQNYFYSLATPAGNTFYLVVPRSGTREGSYGKTSAGAERPPAVNACLVQNVAACP